MNDLDLQEVIRAKQKGIGVFYNLTVKLQRQLDEVPLGMRNGASQVSNSVS